MKLIKIRFTEWREKPFTRSAATEKKLDEIDTQERVKRAELIAARQLIEDAGERNLPADSPLRAGVAAIAAELQQLADRRRKVLEAEEQAAREAAEAARNHERVGTFGYQVLNNAGTAVVKEVDADGNDLPAGVTYGSEVVDTNPKPPKWAKEAAPAI